MEKRVESAKQLESQNEEKKEEGLALSNESFSFHPEDDDDNSPLSTIKSNQPNKPRKPNPQLDSNLNEPRTHSRQKSRDKHRTSSKSKRKALERESDKSLSKIPSKKHKKSQNAKRNEKGSKIMHENKQEAQKKPHIAQEYGSDIEEENKLEKINSAQFMQPISSQEDKNQIEEEEKHISPNKHSNPALQPMQNPLNHNPSTSTTTTHTNRNQKQHRHNKLNKNKSSMDKDDGVHRNEEDQKFTVTKNPSLDGLCQPEHEYHIVWRCVSCPWCNEIYNWHNYPLVLMCRHKVCRKCLFMLYGDSQLNSEIITLFCIQCEAISGNRGQEGGAYVYRNPLRGNFHHFIRFNFKRDYESLRLAYKEFPEQALAAESNYYSQGAEFFIFNNVTAQPSGSQNKIQKDPNFEFGTPKKEGELQVYPFSQEKFEPEFPKEDKFSDFDPKELQESREEVLELYKMQSQVQKDAILCLKCKRVFNYRNIPFNLKCGHKVCEHCVNKFCKKGKISVRILCPVDSTTEVFKGYMETFVLRLFLRRKVPFDDVLLRYIFDVFKYESKKAASEFSRKNSKIKEIICCSACGKDYSVSNPPIQMMCSHSICLQCTKEQFEKRDKESPVFHIMCPKDKIGFTYDKVPDDVNPEVCFNFLQSKMKQDAFVLDFILECYSTPESEEIYPQQVKKYATEEVFEKECNLCMEDYSSKKRPFKMPCNEHRSCEQCLLHWVKKNTSSESVVLECPTCRKKKKYQIKDTSDDATILRLFKLDRDLLKKVSPKN